MIIVPLSVGIVIAAIGGAVWLWELCVTKPRQRRERAERKRDLF